MDPTTLHQVARRHLRRRHDELTGAYGKLPNGGRASDGFSYTSQAKRIYPRYHVVAAILEQIERLDPDRPVTRAKQMSSARDNVHPDPHRRHRRRGGVVG